LEDTWKAKLLKRKRLAAAIAVIVVIVASGFAVGLTVYSPSRVGVEEYGVEKPGVAWDGREPTPAPAPMPDDEKGAGVVTTSLEIVNRKIVYNAWLSLEVQDVDVAVSQLQAISEEFGGYVAHMSVSKGKDVKTGSVTLRVPQADTFAVIGRVEQLGEVKDKNIGSEDVTERYVDLKARLENAQLQEQRLLEILDKAYDIEDMLNIERELSWVREQIEVYTGQLAYLESRVEYATITVALSEPSLSAPLPEVDWDATVKTGLWGLFVIVQGLIVLAFVIIPLVVVGVPIYYVYSRRRKKRQVPENKAP